MPPPPPSPPQLPLLLPLPAPQPIDQPAHKSPAFFRAAFEALLPPTTTSPAQKWPLVFIHPPFPSPSSPPDAPAWGLRARAVSAAEEHLASFFVMPPRLADSLCIWRREQGSVEAKRYEAFYPIDSTPHVALLDPRSGERLAVWSGAMADDGMLSPQFCESVCHDLIDFLQNHQLQGAQLGPLHYLQKSWTVRTRRVDETVVLPPTSLMDDEDAAIAAAIAASLMHSPDEMQDDDDENDDDDDGMSQTDDESQFASETYSNDQSDQEVSYDDQFDSQSDVAAKTCDFDTRASNDSTDDLCNMSFSSSAMPGPETRPQLITRKEVGPSSLESLSSSYLERMQSRFRSEQDPVLIEQRRLREEQDAELAASLQLDKARIAQEQADCAKLSAQAAAKGRAQTIASARLPVEPPEGATSVTVAVRLPDGNRIMRRFNSFDQLQAVADFISVSSEFTNVLDACPAQVLRMPGVALNMVDWKVHIEDLGIGKRAAFILGNV